MNKLLQINITANWGSTGKIAEQIGKEAMANGWESYIAYGRIAGPSTSHLIHIGNMWDERWHGLQTRLFDRHGLASNNATRRFIKDIEKVHPDIIHLHNIHGYYLNYPILFEYLAKSDIPVVWTLHDCWPFTGHCAYFDAVNCKKWKSGCSSCPIKNSFPASFIDKSKSNFEKKKHYFNLPKKMTLVPVSHWLEGLLKESILSKYPVRTIHNGISLDNFMQSKNRMVKTGKPIILGVASVWAARKGLPDFVKLSEMQDLQIILIGVDESTRKSLPENIIAISRTSNQNELAEYYSTADVFVNPTYEDNFPTVNIEALACGTPVITYNTGGSPESLTPKTGIVVDRGDVDGLYKAIKTILDKSPADKEAQRNACIERSKEFDARKKFKEYIDLYEQILSDK